MPKRRECDDEQLPVVKLLAGPRPPGFGYEAVRAVRDITRLRSGATISYLIDLSGNSEVRIEVKPSRLVNLAMVGNGQRDLSSQNVRPAPPDQSIPSDLVFRAVQAGCYEFVITNRGRRMVDVAFSLTAVEVSTARTRRRAARSSTRTAASPAAC